MADKSIFELTLQTTFASNDRLVVGNYANSDAEAITGQTLVNLLATSLDGHGGIQSIAKTSSSGTDPVIDTYTITMADTSTTTFTVTNGLKGDTGLQTFIYFRWAHVQPSSWSDTTSQPDEWMGVYAGTATTPPTTVSAYTWVKVRGETGETGEAASISSQSVTYMGSTSGTIVPSGSWSENVPSVTPGNFLWTRTQLAFNDGSVVTAYSVSRFGIDGTGSVSTVNSISPDGDGNVALTADDIPLTNNVSVEDTIDQIETDMGDVSNLTTAASNCVGAINELKTSLSVLTGNHNIKMFACTIRNDGTGWKFINDSGHVPINVSSVSVNASGDIEIALGYTAEKVVTCLVTPDEAFAPLYDIGASVGTSIITLQVYNKPISYGGFVSYTQNGWNLDRSDFTSASFDTTNGRLRLTHQSETAIGIDTGADHALCSVTGRETSLFAVCGGYSAGNIDVLFKNVSGTIVKTLSTDMKCFVSKSYSPWHLNANDIVSNIGNFWIIGLMEV